MVFPPLQALAPAQGDDEAPAGRGCILFNLAFPEGLLEHLADAQEVNTQ